MIEPVIRSTIFEAASSAHLAELFTTRSDRFYARFGNPTVREAARALAVLEGAEAGLLFGSGMAAITTCLFALTRAGSHVVAQRDIFAQTYTFLRDIASRFGVNTTFVDATDPRQIAAAVTADTALIYVETPSNPLLRLVDIAAVTAIAQHHDVPLVVDSTFATPIVQQPVALGASLVVHSATKYLGGHSDICCGAVLGRSSLLEGISELQRLLGGISEPDTAWLLLRSLKTLNLRVERQCRSALEVARFLERAPGVSMVHYPGLVSSPYHALAQRQMRAGGGVVAFEVVGGLEAARAVVDGLRLVRIATSLGGTDSVAEIPAELDFAASEIGVAEVESRVPVGLIRLSVGLEDPQDLTADLARALQEVFGAFRKEAVDSRRR